MSVLGREALTEFIAVRVPGRILWFNFELARECGFDVPPAMSPEFHSRLIQMFSLRAMRPDESLDGREPVILYADRYGGADIEPCLGAGRAGFLCTGNFYLKGIGHTPLYRRNENDDFQHTHGGLSLRESMFEAVFGEVDHKLLTQGAARILAIIDQGDYTVYPNRFREPRAIVVRAGAQLRPAHLFARGLKGDRRFELFLRMARATGQLIGGASPDLKATMLRIVEDHALTAAELFRWRMLHGAISLSNTELSGAMLDTTTQSAQPRTAPVKILTYHSDVNIIYGREHLQRAEELQLMYRAIVGAIPWNRRAALNAQPIDFAREMKRSFDWHLQLQLLTAAGLREPVAECLRAQYPAVAVRFMTVVTAMAALRNPGSVNANRAPIEKISVLDVFGCLARYPTLYFGGADQNIEEYLAPVFRGNSYYRANKRAAVDALIVEFRNAYSGVMRACGELAPRYYRGAGDMRTSIISRAAFENRPLNLLYRWNILNEFRQTVDLYKTSDDSGVISRFISARVAASHRMADRTENGNHK